MDFCRVSTYLSPDQTRIIINALKDEWSRIVGSGFDFGVLGVLPLDLFELLIEQLNGAWLKIFPNLQSFVYESKCLSIEQHICVIEKLNQRWIDIIQAAKGDKYFKQTIHDLCDMPRNDIWGYHVQLQKTIKELDTGIQDLLQFCRLEDIERFLEAMVSQDANQINKAFTKLLTSNNPSRKHLFFACTKPQLDHQKEISSIVSEKFPDFCTKHLHLEICKEKSLTNRP